MQKDVLIASSVYRPHKLLFSLFFFVKLSSNITVCARRMGQASVHDKQLAQSVIYASLQRDVKTVLISKKVFQSCKKTKKEQQSY